MEFELTVKFILEIKKRKSIWNLFSPEYQDINLKKKEWMEVCCVFYGGFENLSSMSRDLLEKQLQSKWSGIKQCYIRSIRAVRSKPYRYAKYLEFLDQIALSRSPFSNEGATTRLQLNYYDGQQANEEKFKSGNDITVGDDKKDNTDSNGKSTVVSDGKSSAERDGKVSLLGKRIRESNNDGRESIKSGKKDEEKIIQHHSEVTDEEMETSEATESTDDEMECCASARAGTDVNGNEATSSNAPAVRSMNKKEKSKFPTRKIQKIKRRSCRCKTCKEKKLENSIKNQIGIYIERNYRETDRNICDHMHFFRSLLPFLQHFQAKEAMKFRLDVMKIAIEHADSPSFQGNFNHANPAFFPTPPQFDHSPPNQNLPTEFNNTSDPQCVPDINTHISLFQEPTDQNDIYNMSE